MLHRQLQWTARSATQLYPRGSARSPIWSLTPDTKGRVPARGCCLDSVAGTQPPAGLKLLTRFSHGLGESRSAIVPHFVTIMTDFGGFRQSRIACKLLNYRLFGFSHRREKRGYFNEASLGRPVIQVFSCKEYRTLFCDDNQFCGIKATISNCKTIHGL